MNTYYPTWKLRTTVFIVGLLFAYLAFSVATFFLIYLALVDAFFDLNKNSALFLILPICMLIGLFIWSRGLIELSTKRFTLKFSEGNLIFGNEGGWLIKEKVIRVGEIEDVEIKGLAEYGSWIVVYTKTTKVILGHLLSRDDAFKIVGSIRTEVNRTGQPKHGEDPRAK